MSRSKTYELSFQVGASLAGSFSTVFKGAGNALAQLNAQMEGLGSQKAATDKLIDMRDALSSSTGKLNAARGHLASLTKELKDAGIPADKVSESLKQLTSQMDKLGQQKKGTKQLLDLHAALDRSEAQLKGARAHMQALGDAMNSAGVPTRNMALKMESAAKAVEKAEAAYTAQRVALQTLSHQMGAVGKSTQQLAAEMLHLEAQTKKASTAQENLQKMDKATQQMAKAQAQVDKQRQSLHALNEKMGTSGTSTAKLVEDQKRLEQQLKKSTDAQKQLQKITAAQQANKAARADKRGQLFDGVAMAATMGAPIKTAMDFEYAMSGVAAVSQASTEDLARMTAEARKLGATTVWSASQAAEGMNFLAMAGFKTNDIIQAMPGMLNLASAGKLELGRAADIASNILTGFKLEAGEAGRVADVMTNAFTASNVSVEMLGETMKYASGPAAGLGVSLETVTAMTGKLGDAGIQGSMAGTALRAIMGRLAAGPKPATDALKQLNIQTKDANGNLRDMPTILKEISKATEKMGNADRAQIFKDLGGEEAYSALQILTDQAGSGSLQEFIKKMEVEDSAKRVAKTMNDNTRGAMVEMQSAFESLSISVGNALLPAVASVARAMAGVMQKITGFAEKFPGLTKAVVVLGASMGAIGVAAIAGGYAFTVIRGGVLGVQAALASARAAAVMFGGALQSTGVAGKAAAGAMRAMTAAQWLFNVALSANPIGLVVAAVGALAVAGLAVYKYWEPIKGFFSGLWSGIQAGLAPLKPAFDAAFGYLAPVIDAVRPPFEWLGNAISGVISWFKNLLVPVDAASAAVTSAGNAGQNFGVMIGNAITTVIGFFGNLVGAVSGAVASMVGAFTTGAQAIYNTVVGGIQAIGTWLASFSLFDSGVALLKTLADGIKSAVSAPVEAIKGALSKVRQFLPFSDAKEGPLSELTLSGSKILSTLGEGMLVGAPAAVKAAATALAPVAEQVLQADAPGLQVRGGNGLDLTGVTHGMASVLPALLPPKLAGIGGMAAQLLAPSPQTDAQPAGRGGFAGLLRAVSAPSAAAAAAPVSVAGGGGDTFNVTINVGGGGDPAAAHAAGRAAGRGFEEQMKQYQAARRRTSYAAG